MNKVCFLCPIYDSGNHFQLGYNLVKSMNKYQINDDIYFIFSNDAQAQKFNTLTKNLTNKIKSIIIPENYLHYKSKVVVKKLFGLQRLMNIYDYIALIDCETIFLKKGNFYEIFKEISDKHLCLNSNISYDGFFILRACFKQLGLYNNRILKKEFSNYKYNFWFNEIQVYDCKLLPEFFEWLDQFDKDKYLNECCCFEYYLYAAFLILKKGFHINKFRQFKSMGGIMEYLPIYPVNKQIRIIETLNSHWTSSEVTTNKSYLQFHLDRLNKNGYGYNESPLKLKLKRFIFLLLRR